VFKTIDCIVVVALSAMYERQHIQSFKVLFIFLKKRPNALIEEFELIEIHKTFDLSGQLANFLK